MKIYINNHKYHFEIENVSRLFFPNEKIILLYDETVNDEYYILSKIYGDNIIVTVNFIDFSKSLSSTVTNDDKEDERRIAECLYLLLCDYTGITQPWGMITGVRPVKLFRRIKEEHGTAKAISYFKDSLHVSSDKLCLAVKTEATESKILSLTKRNSFSLYVSIPFCPSRCSYCSFISSSAPSALKLIEPYVGLLCEEIKETAIIAKSLNLQLETVYIGGGTPTTLSAGQMNMLLKTINSSFDMSTCKEFTVEAGRPDTITKDKLKAIKNNNVERISINPQTLNDGVLSAIGRNHTVAQTYEALDIANQIGFKNINMDIIAGLPTDTIEFFKNTIDGIIDLSPQSITVHTLSIKRSAGLTKEGTKISMDDSNLVKQMLTYSNDMLEKYEYYPYYLYRQSRMLGNFENTGYSKVGSEGMYNVYVMDETHTILACGAGGVTKLKEYGTNKLDRIFNYKYPFEYINDFKEIIARKKGIIDFYETYYG